MYKTAYNSIFQWHINRNTLIKHAYIIDKFQHHVERGFFAKFIRCSFQIGFNTHFSQYSEQTAERRQQWLQF